MKVQFCPPVASPEFYELLMQFALNLIVLLILCRAMYFRWNRNPEYMFAQLITGVIVFMICAMLRWVQLELGLVLGLFAIFAIIRFRTLNVPVKEMAYLFMVVGISAINALLQMSHCLQWIIFVNIILIMLTFIMEKVFFSKRLSRRTITYNKPDLLRPSNHKLLLQELAELTELNIVRFEIGKVDYVKGNAQIRIYFTGDGNGSFNEVENGNDDD
jgi:predicted membrane channel-forming protein YqfA (hemolysin III family)